MNNELIKIEKKTIGEEEVTAVDARELHAFLEVGKVFAAWIQERIEQYGFKENLDYEVFSKSGKNPTGGRPSKEYYVSIDMAKELAMVERNEKGKQARQYFIECEKIAKKAAIGNAPKIKKPSISRVNSDFNAFVKMAKTFGIEGNQALLTANKSVIKLHGFNCMEALGVTHLISKKQELDLTPTAIGNRLGGIPATQVNKLLKSAGFQKSFRDAKKKLQWEPTEKGKPYSMIKDTNKKHSDGTPVKQLFWTADIVPFVEDELNGLDGIKK